MAKAATVERSDATQSKPTPTAVDEAKARVVALAQRELAFYQRSREVKDELAEAERSGDFQKAAALRAEILYLDSGIAGRDERRAAIIHLRQLQAEGMLKEAARLRSEAASKRLRTDETLAALKEHEGVDFTPHALARSSSHQMDTDAMNLEGQAKDLLRDGSIKEQGVVTGYNADELVKALLSHPEIIGPSIASIYERASNPQFKSKTAGQRLRMEFTRIGIIDLNGDGVVIRAGQGKA